MEGKIEKDRERKMVKGKREGERWWRVKRDRGREMVQVREREKDRGREIGGDDT